MYIITRATQLCHTPGIIGLLTLALGKDRPRSRIQTLNSVVTAYLISVVAAIYHGVTVIMASVGESHSIPDVRGKPAVLSCKEITIT